MSSGTNHCPPMVLNPRYGKLQSCFLEFSGFFPGLVSVQSCHAFFWGKSVQRAGTNATMHGDCVQAISGTLVWSVASVVVLASPALPHGSS